VDAAERRADSGEGAAEGRAGSGVDMMRRVFGGEVVGGGWWVDGGAALALCRVNA